METIELIEELATRGIIEIFNDRYICFRVTLKDEENRIKWESDASNLDRAVEELNTMIGDYYEEQRDGL
jgi:hypothetical protein